MQYGTAKLVLDKKKHPPAPGSTITSDYARVVSIRSRIESDIADIGNKHYEDHDTKLLIDPRDIEVGSDDDRARLQYSGAFVGNHVYKCLKKCREISQVRNSRLAHCAAQHMSIDRIELINNVIFLS